MSGTSSTSTLPSVLQPISRSIRFFELKSASLILRKDTETLAASASASTKAAAVSLSLSRVVCSSVLRLLV